MPAKRGSLQDILAGWLEALEERGMCAQRAAGLLLFSSWPCLTSSQAMGVALPLSCLLPISLTALSAGKKVGIVTSFASALKG